MQQQHKRKATKIFTNKKKRRRRKERERERELSKTNNQTNKKI